MANRPPRTPVRMGPGHYAVAARNAAAQGLCIGRYLANLVLAHREAQEAALWADEDWDA